MIPADFANKFQKDYRKVSLDQLAASIYCHTHDTPTPEVLLDRLAVDLDAWATLETPNEPA